MTSEHCAALCDVTLGLCTYDLNLESKIPVQYSDRTTEVLLYRQTGAIRLNLLLILCKKIFSDILKPIVNSH